MKEYENEYADIHYHLPSELEKSGGLQLLRIGRNKAKSNYQVGPRLVKYYSLHFVLEGQLKLIWEGREHLLSVGDLFCLRPGVIHSYMIENRKSPLRMFWITFVGSQADSLLQLIGLTDNPFRRKAASEQIHKRIEHILHLAGADERFHSSLSLMIAVYQLFDELARYTGQYIKEDQPWLMKALEYIRTYYREGLSVGEVADYVGVDRSHLTRSFVHHMNLTPNLYIQSLRMQEANELLQRNEMSIREIALSIGFHDAYSFTRAYKRVHGRTPSEARRWL